MRKEMKRVAASAAALMICSVLFTQNTSADYSDEVDELEYEQYRISKEIEDLEWQLSRFEEGARENEEYMRIYDEKMRLKEEEITNIRFQITSLEAQINLKKAETERKEKEVEEELDQFRSRLRVMYMEGNDSRMSVVTGSQDFYDLLMRSELVQRMSRMDHDMIEDLKFDLRSLESEKKSLEEDKARQLEKKQEATENLEELRQIYSEHAETKAYFEAKAEAARDETAEMRAKREDVEYELQVAIRKQQEENERLERERREREEREEQERREREAQQSYEEEYYSYSYYDDDDDDDDYEDDYDDYEESYDDYSYSYSSSSGDLCWPCPGVWNITDGYGWRTIDEEGGASDFHGGIDINKPGCYGEEIVAAASGTVITASDTGNGYGIHVVIDHGGRLATLYGHMSSCTVSVGEYVSQGQTIGYIGSTGYAYGNHCHFEVRVDGERVDPLDYVDY